VTGGRIDVSTAMTAGRASVRVANTGPVIPADQLDRLFPASRPALRRALVSPGDQFPA